MNNVLTSSNKFEIMDEVFENASGWKEIVAGWSTLSIKCKNIIIDNS